MAKYTPKTRDELEELVKDESIYLGDIDTSAIIVMKYAFAESTRRDFRGIETWDTSSVVNMEGMFYNAKYFNHNINSWDTSSVITMNGMFQGATNFNQPLDSWDTSNVVDMRSMFLGAENFNQPLDNWDTSSVVNMFAMFMNATNFNQPLDSWDTSNVEIMSRMFSNATSFNQNLDSWDISSVEDNQQMFWWSGIENLPKWWEKRIAVAELGEGGEDRSGFDGLLKFADEKTRQAMIAQAQALLNPLSKEEKQRKKEERQKEIQAKQQQANEKPFYKSTLFICVAVVLIGIGFGWIKSNSKTPKPKESVSTTRTEQPRQSTPSQEQKPTLVMPKCDEKGLLDYISNLQIKGINDTFKDNPNKWTEIKEQAKAKGIEYSSVQKYVSNLKLDYSNIKTTLTDASHYKVECSAKVVANYPLPHTEYLFEYSAQNTEIGKTEVKILKIEKINKDKNTPKASNESQSVTQNAPSDESKNANSAQSAQSKNIQASFDCAKANTRVERLICADEELANLDIELANAYANARNSLDNEGKKTLLSEQKKWLENYNQCDDKPCVLHNLRKRIRALKVYDE